MMGRMQPARFAAVALLCALGVFACASLPDLRVHYDLPPPSTLLQGQRVAVEVEDARETKDVLGPGARKTFGNFTGNFSFTLARHGEKAFLIGVYLLPDLVARATERHLRNAGAEVLPAANAGAPRFRIVLNAFDLDRAERGWRARVGFEAQLHRTQGAPLVAYQGVGVEGERFGLLARQTVDTLLAEVFTDALNRLNLKGLFGQAGLLEQ